MREFIPFDDCWFDDLPGPLVPLPMNVTCVRGEDGVFHWVPGDASENVITSPLARPSFAAVPALSSST